MATQVWQPPEEGVREICKLLHDHLYPDADKPRIWERLQSCRQFPDFNNYLAYILCHAEGQPVEVRQSAGLLLKNNLVNSWATTGPAYQQYIKGELLPCIGATDRQLRVTVGTAISVVVQQGGVQAWPEVFQAVVQCLDSNDFNHMEGALDALFKICEEMPLALDVDIPGFPDRPINALLPRLLRLFSSPHASIRKLAVGCVNQFIVQMPPILATHMDSYLQGLFSISQDPSGEVRKLVCSALVQLLATHPHVLEPHIRNVIEYMLHATQDKEDEVALEACEFWSAYCEARLPPDLLREFLARLTGILLTNMVYHDDDEALVDADDDESAPDREEDMKPFLHRSKVHGNDGTEQDEDDDDYVNAWNLRKCSAAGLDILSTVFQDDLLPLLMPLVQARLSNDTDEGWKDREAAVLALGAIAEGCINGLMPVLSQVVAFLLPLLDDKRPLVRSITCWTLSRYSKWIVQSIQTPEGHAQFDAVLGGMLRRILDKNKRVQEAACSAFATLEEEAADELCSRMESILQHLMFAFKRYQRRNLRILYDAIGTLADVTGNELAEPRYLEIIMPPLIGKWQELQDSDKDLFPLLECLTSVAQALGPAFQGFAEPVFVRCLNLIRSQQLVKSDPARTAHYDKEFIVCALDLLSGLCEALGPSLDGLVGRSDLRELLFTCCADEAPDVRQSAFALLGDLAKVPCVSHLQPRLQDLLNLATTQLQSWDALTKENVSVANNACWAIGEIAVKASQEVAGIVRNVMQCLVPVLASTEVINKSLLENSAITLGRLAWVSPDIMAPYMEHFMVPWCRALRQIRDDIEKEDAFRGLCALVRANPSGGVASFIPMCQAIGSWHEIKSNDLKAEVASILHGYKELLQGHKWDQYVTLMEAPLREKLSRKYNM
eukprot:TRINITY_DN19250_c0_g1_i1.p1 TRINITY_DN19250_c0_g1~~TRINITY_DN19250_c0_g1_i1.p1  ORF type:complete len:894 (-),score=159.66 TRINITY_DN19250_c0_g1_i1:1054-3735(-)